MEKERKERERWRGIQMMVWVSLALLQMALVYCLDVRAEAAVPYEREVEQLVTYEKVEGASLIPEEIEVDVQDGNQRTTAVCACVEVTESGGSWEGGFELPVTVHVYDADTYFLGEREIRKEQVLWQLMDAEEELLAAADLSPADYLIQEVRWDGGIYTDAEGVQCRDAIAVGQKRVYACQVKYVGTAVFAGVPSYQAMSGGSGAVVIEEPVESAGAVETAPGVSKEGTAVQVLEEDEGEQEDGGLTFWEKVTRMLVWAIGIGILLFLLGLVLLVGLHMAKKIHLWYDGYKSKRR